MIVGDLRPFNLGGADDADYDTGEVKGASHATRELMLQAEDQTLRLMWVYFLKMARDAALDAFE